MKHVYVSRDELKLLLSRLENKDATPIEKKDLFGGKLETLYLTRRNIRVLLSKLDRKANGEDTVCTIVKNDTVHPIYPCSVQLYVTAIDDHTTPSPSGAVVHAIEDEAYYTERDAGRMHPSDEASA